MNELSPPGSRPTPSKRLMGAVGVAGVALSLIAAAIALPGAGPGAASGRALIVALPTAVGLYAWRRRADERFGPLIVLVGFTAFLSTFAESSDAYLYSVGRVAGWLVEVGLVFLVLSFPSGRLPERADRLLVAAAALLVATLYLPTIPLVDSYPSPSHYGSCVADCPSNAFFLLDSQPAAIDALIRPLRELLTILLFLAVTARVGVRVRDATPLLRRTLVPVLGVAIARSSLMAAALVVRLAFPYSGVVPVLTWMLALALPAMAVGFLVGLVRWRLYVAGALERLGARLHAHMTPVELRDSLREALGDPSLWLAYRVQAGDGSWVGADGQAVTLPSSDDSDCRVTRLRLEGITDAAIVHDGALSGQNDLLAAVGSYARLMLENRHLAERLESSLRQVSASRTRIAVAADDERRRIERDLHDGAQQRLVALRIELQLTADSLGRDPVRDREQLAMLGARLGRALDEIRDLAHGVYPSLLAQRGLADSLRTAALRVPMPTMVAVDGIGRYPQAVEGAVYFCCLEALQNASKHAPDATAVRVSLVEDHGLRFEVEDDGAGFDPREMRDGAGLTNMRDRLATVGGRLVIRSRPGLGTTVEGTVPVDDAGDGRNGTRPGLPAHGTTQEPAATVVRAPLRW